MNILEQIVTSTRADLLEKKHRMPLSDLQKMINQQTPALDFKTSLQGNHIRLIAEVKQASPSKGLIRRDFHPANIARIYAANGAAAISVLTEPHYFLGQLDYLRQIRLALGESNTPLLRKDFIVDEYHVYEARAYGADSLLLIAAILSEAELKNLTILSRRLGMEPLVETHNEAEILMALSCGADIVGVNNRDLNTFITDIRTTEKLRSLIPTGKTVVSESGIQTHGDVQRLQKAGVNAVLIGEALMAASDIGVKMRELML
ncbi:MAG: indole-3-glycerol phosphate synthase TrpC [Dehalococcoidales bacterium]|nr:indole-3-glycerol phosphate synthase TrpC [Dehalococcoidales bacterium]